MCTWTRNRAINKLIPGITSWEPAIINPTKKIVIQEYLDQLQRWPTLCIFHKAIIISAIIQNEFQILHEIGWHKQQARSDVEDPSNGHLSYKKDLPSH